MMGIVSRIDIHPHPDRKLAIVVVGGSSIVCEYADIDDNDNLVLYMGKRSIACLETKYKALEVPNMIRKAIIVNTSFTWGG